MRPVTVTVGPLATASANNIVTSQSVAAGATAVFTTTAVSGGSYSSGFAATGSTISGNLLTLGTITSGAPVIGQLVQGTGVLANTFIQAIGNSNSTWIVSRSQTVGSTTIYGAPVMTMDTPRRIQITSAGNDSSNTFTVVGTDWFSNPLTESLAGGNGAAVYTASDFRTVTQIYPTSATASTITVGTNGVASSAWVRFDEYSTFPTAIQATVTTAMGTNQTYTIQQTLQDPNSPTNPVAPYLLTWINSADPAVVGSTISAQSSYTYAPAFAKVTLNYGTPTATTTGAVSAIFTQNASSSF